MGHVFIHLIIIQSTYRGVIMSTRLIIVRHGETEYNLQKRYQGQMESSLTQRGREQAACAAERLKGERFDAIFSSPLSRAMDTAAIIRGERDTPIIPDMRLAEIKCGIWEGMQFDEMKAQFPNEMNTWLTQPHLHRMPGGGETLEDVKARACDFLDAILHDHKGKTILVVSHVVVILMMMMHFAGERPEDIWSAPKQGNTAINIVEIGEDGKTDIIARGESPDQCTIKDIETINKPTF
jgi:broad specificity phosphatase PhoE